MFGIDWGNSQTLWLNLTNLALGIVTLLALGDRGLRSRTGNPRETAQGP